MQVPLFHNENLIPEFFLRLSGVSSHTHGTTEYTGWDTEQPRVTSIDSKTLSRVVREQVRATHPSIQMQYGWTLESGDLSERFLEFRDASGVLHTATYDLLIGADGGRSKVRSLMHTQVCCTSLKKMSCYLDGYWTLPLPSYSGCKQVLWRRIRHQSSLTARKSWSTSEILTFEIGTIRVIWVPSRLSPDVLPGS